MTELNFQQKELKSRAWALLRPPADDAVHSPVTRALRPGDEEKQHQVEHWHMLPHRLFEALFQIFRFNFMRLFFTISTYLRGKKKESQREHSDI